MAAHSIGTATVSFGLVSVPVRLYSTADNTRKVSFNWIHKASGARVRQRYWDPKAEKLVDREDLVKGYEFAKDQYVLFTPEELQVLEAQATNSIDIAEFVPMGKVERHYLDRAYFLGPDRGGERAYRLLSAALKKTKRAALGRYAARGKEYLVLVRPFGDGLVMEQLHYAHELKAFSDVPLGEGEVKKEELALAVQLVEQASTDSFEPEKYDDEVTKRILALIEKKVEGEEIRAAPSVEPETKIIDLMDALKASLAGTETPKASERKPARRASTRKKTTKAKKTGSQ